MNKIKKTKILISFVSVLVPLFLIWNSATWNAGFYHDDAVTSTYYGAAKINNQTALSYAQNQLKDMLVYQGRFAPAYNYLITTCLILIGENLTVYRIWHSAWMVSSLLLAAYFVSYITKQRKLAVVFFIFVISLMSVTTYHDALLSYGVVFPQVTFFGFASLTFFQKGLEEQSNYKIFYYLFGSCFLGISILTSEFGLVFAPCAILLLILQTKNIKDIIWSVSPMLLCFFYICLTMVLKEKNQYTGASFGSITLHSIIKTFLFQLSGTIPSAFIFSKMGTELFSSQLKKDLITNPSFWIIFLLALPFFYFQMTINKKILFKNKVFIVYAGILLLFLPALMTSFSEKYQKELMWGVGYMQSYLQIIGLGFILLFFYTKIIHLCQSDRNKYIVQAAICSLVAFLFAANYQINKVAVNYLNTTWQEPREKLAFILQKCVFSSDKHISILINRGWLARWETPAFFFCHTNKKTLINVIEDIFKDGSKCPEWFIDTDYDSCGAALIAKAEFVENTPKKSKIYFQKGSAYKIFFVQRYSGSDSEEKFRLSNDLLEKDRLKKQTFIFQNKLIQIVPEDISFLEINRT